MFGVNQLKTTALLGLLSGLIVLAGYYLIGNEQGLLIGFVIAAFTSIGSWYFSDQAALASYRAQPLAKEQAPDLYNLIERLSQKAEIPMPTVFIVPTKSPNAFATGRDPQHAAVAVTEGIMELLSEEELAGSNSKFKIECWKARRRRAFQHSIFQGFATAGRKPLKNRSEFGIAG